MMLSLPSASALPRRLLAPVMASVVSVSVLLTGCTQQPDTESEQVPAADTPPEAEADRQPDADVEAQPSGPLPDQGLPVETFPEVPGGRENATDCPYLDTQWVADTNGQRMTGYGLDERFDIPACVYWSYPEQPQAQVMVRTMPDAHLAMDVVDWAAPIDSTDLAESPAGWSGGRGQLGDGGAVYAVAKGNTAVVVWTNQEQSFKAQQIAEEAITNLDL